jgi:hypothetical protein|tara:strand:+ start:564 stop:782 length:219 start_codon:yes stop_codon:yes gene_type:complete
MRQYTVKVDSGNGVQNVWTGDSLSRAHYNERITDEAWGGKAMVWVYDNVNKEEVESYPYIKDEFESNSLYVS